LTNSKLRIFSSIIFAVPRTPSGCEKKYLSEYSIPKYCALIPGDKSALISEECAVIHVPLLYL
jgi:hypothetical protein